MLCVDVFFVSWMFLTVGKMVVSVDDLSLQPHTHALACFVRVLANALIFSKNERILELIMKYYAPNKPIVMDVVWSPLSLRRFEEIENYLKINFGEKSANEFTYKLLSTVDLIHQNTEVGKKITNDIRAFVVVRQISIHYRISTCIEILTLWDNRQMPIF